LHISIAGSPGSGKSTVCAILNAKYGFPIYSTGAIQREIALEHGVSTLEMNQIMARDLSFDHMIDSKVSEISVERQNETVIFDSRMAWKFAKNSFKVYVAVDPFVAAERVMGEPRGEEENYTDLEEAERRLIERGQLENERFQEIYGVDNLDPLNYDLVIDSTYMTPGEVASVIYEKFQAYCEAKAL